MSDLISRQAALAEFVDGRDVYDIMESIESLPSADAIEVVRCKDCKWYEYMQDVCHNPRFGDGHANYCPPCVAEDYFCKDGERMEP